MEKTVVSNEDFQKHLIDYDSTYEAADEHDQLSRAYYQLGKIHYDKADLKKAEELFILSINTMQLPRDFFSLFKAYGFLIRISSERLDDLSAQGYINKCNDLFQNWDSKLGSLNSEYFLSLGVLYNYQGNIKEALEILAKAKELSKKENEPEVLAKILYTLGTIHFHSSENVLALECLKELSEILQIIDKAYLRASMNLLLGQIYSSMDEFEKSVEHYKKANIHFKLKKSWNQYGYVLLGRGNILKKTGKVDQAMGYYETALEFSDGEVFRRLEKKVRKEIEDLNDSNVDIYLDRSNRKVFEKTLGLINFKHRFVLLEILFLLAKSPGEYFDKDMLSKEIWKEEYNPLIHDKLIYTSISRLRKLIEPKNAKGEKRKYLIRGKDGYAFNPDVKICFHLAPQKEQEKTIANIEISDPV